MKMSDCCLNALKHGFATCPHCGQILMVYGPKQSEIIFNQKQR